MTSRHPKQPDRAPTMLQPPVFNPQPAPLHSPPQPAALVQRAARSPAALTPAEVLQLHRTLGNRAVGQLVRGHLSRQTSGPAASHAGVTVQPKLMVGPVGDPYEQEADRVAQRLDAEPLPAASQAVQRQAEDDAEPLPLQPAAIQLQSGERGMTVSPALEATIQQARGGGQPLPEALRGRMEQALDADFQGVRLHTDVQADTLNRSLQARAFTTGQDVFFGQGAYQPGSASGRELLAHELAHVMQQHGISKSTRIQRNGGTEGAGTKPRSFTQGKEYLVKYTSAREKFVYEHSDALGLADILPDYYAVEPADPNSATVTSVQTARGAIVNLEDPLTREDDKDLIMVRTVGYVHASTKEKPYKIVMDIKIGSYTKSQMQFEEEGAEFLPRGVKGVEHFFKDLRKGNRASGFSILSGKKEYEEACLRATGKTSRNNLRAATAKIISDLGHIQRTMAQAVENITFVGSSMLCVLNLSDPQGSEGKMIDPDHPILTVRGDRGEDVPKDVLTPERLDLHHRAKLETDAMYRQLNPAIEFNTTWEESNKDVEEWQAQAKDLTAQYLAKYKANYTDGLKQLINFFQERKNDLDKKVSRPMAYDFDPYDFDPYEFAPKLFFGY